MKQNLLIVSIILVTLTFIQNICNLPQTSVAHAEVKTFEGDGYYIADAINSELPEYAKQRAFEKAKRIIVDKVSYLIKKKYKKQNIKLKKDELRSIASNIIKITDVQYDVSATIDLLAIQYHAHVKAEVDIDQIEIEEYNKK